MVGSFLSRNVYLLPNSNKITELSKDELGRIIDGAFSRC